MIEKYYNIHDVVKFKIVATSTLNFRFSNIFASHGNFESFSTEDLDFVVFLGQFDPSNRNCDIVEDKYYIREGYFYCKTDSYKFTKWEFEIAGLENKGTVVRIFSNFFGYMWMAGFIIEFMIHYKLNQKGYSIVHASCVSKGGNGLLFSARGGGGKTTMAMYMLDKGFKLLGDNFVILHKGVVLSYLSPLNIFSYNLTPIIKRNLSFKDHLILGMKYAIYSFTLHYVKIFTKINPQVILDKSVANTADLSEIALLIPGDSLNIEQISKEKLCDHLVINQMLDTILFIPYLEEYSYIYPKSSFSSHWCKYKESLISNIPDNVRFHRIIVPRVYNEDVINKIFEGIYNE